jgi:hypothetical protein
VSVGYLVVTAELADRARSPEALSVFAAADAALRQAKLEGRDRAVAAPLAVPSAPGGVVLPTGTLGPTSADGHQA